MKKKIDYFTILAFLAMMVSLGTLGYLFYLYSSGMMSVALQGGM